MVVADESTNKCRSKECELCTDDDEKIRVSVSPRRFNLPPTVEKKTRMEIVNRNPYPIYFRACTSNMDAFRTRPNAGRIPPNTKASIVVHFFNSAIPVRRHEEVVIVTSMRPFEQCATQDNACQYCLQPMNGTMHDHHSMYPFSSNQNIGGKADSLDHRIYSTRQKDEEDQYIREKADLVDYKGYSTRIKDEEEKYTREKAQPVNYKNYSTRQKYEGVERDLATPDYDERFFDAPLAKKFSNGHQERMRDQCNYELEEICLHAFVHRLRNGGCECGKCFDLSMSDRNELKVKDIYQALKEQRSAEAETRPFFALSQKEEARLAKEKQKLRDRKVHESKLREREAHILARIIKAKDWAETSDTELSEMSSDYFCMRIISEKDFRKKLEKAKFKKRQKQLEEESKSTTTTEEAVTKTDHEKTAKNESAKSPLSRKQQKWTIVAVEEKCNEILHLLWTNFFLLTAIFVTLVAIFTFCCNANGGNGMYNFPCFYDLFN